MLKSFETEVCLPVECVGKYLRGTSAIFSHAFGNYLPGDPEEISNFRVYIDLHGKKIDISELLTERERSILLNNFIESCREEESA
jgi:hypothetical protein